MDVLADHVCTWQNRTCDRYSHVEALWNVWSGLRGHSGLMLAARITLLHFSVSLTMKVSKSAEEPANIALPRSERRACSWGSARIALISLLSLSTMAPGVLLRRPMAHRELAGVRFGVGNELRNGFDGKGWVHRHDKGAAAHAN